MKTDHSSVISGASLLVSLVCLAGVLHVEYKLYEHVQTKHDQSSHDAVMMKTPEKYLLKKRAVESYKSGKMQMRISE